MACTLSGVLVLSAPCAAQFYKWTDASGTVHFSDSPPPPGAGSPKVEVLPEVHYPPAASRPAEPTDDPEPAEPVAEAAPDDDGADDANDYAAEPMENDVGSDVQVIDNAPLDPAVWRRANSPRNRPGQPIRPARRR